MTCRKRITCLFGVILLILATLNTVQADLRDYVICNVPSDEALAFTWQNSNGWWFACGPIQCIQSGDRNELKALDYVFNEGRAEYVCDIMANRSGRIRQVRLYRLHYKLTYGLNLDRPSWDNNVRKYLVQ